MPKTLVPPIKCQGIKTKLVPLILQAAPNIIAPFPDCAARRWIEPFMGSGVVGLNARYKQALLADLNPHLIRFYQAIQSRTITPQIAREFLQHEGNKLEANGEKYYYFIRARFNESGNPLDFLFLSRACFNGMIRFNRKGEFNVPFCRKTERFAKPYITKIVNQVHQFEKVLAQCQWEFCHQDFEKTISLAKENDIIYCDPPYLGRHVDYFDSWTLEDEHRLFQALSQTKSRFILSTWHSNLYRANQLLTTLWSEFSIQTVEHFYHIGAKEENRNPMLEAIVTNFDTAPIIGHQQKTRPQQLLFA